MEYLIQIIGNVLAALYQAGGASLVIAVLFMSALSLIHISEPTRH